MSLSDELYKEVILDHYENPRNFGTIENPDVKEAGANPLCGDELELFINFDGDKIKEIKFHGKGCSISQASASMMTDVVTGKGTDYAKDVINQFKGMIVEDKEPNFSEDLEDLESLNGVKKYPVRVKCAVLAWNTLEKAIKESEK
ncbi:MAG: SUF system NifU family Fe-S cluster assembly protein [Leptospiraceae bacterium]|nr:SUF system NifU family Fe-S cluster assembly protein [Leptospiraceae bacterium]MCP5495629.1 SUF system NifU family Fe-S cluster assembly protein [Leptospiraceae bacterium]